MERGAAGSSLNAARLLRSIARHDSHTDRECQKHARETHRAMITDKCKNRVAQYEPLKSRSRLRCCRSCSPGQAVNQNGDAQKRQNRDWLKVTNACLR